MYREGRGSFAAGAEPVAAASTTLAGSAGDAAATGCAPDVGASPAAGLADCATFSLENLRAMVFLVFVFEQVDPGATRKRSANA